MGGFPIERSEMKTPHICAIFHTTPPPKYARFPFLALVEKKRPPLYAQYERPVVSTARGARPNARAPYVNYHGTRSWGVLNFMPL